MHDNVNVNVYQRYTYITSLYICDLDRELVLLRVLLMYHTHLRIVIP